MSAGIPAHVAARLQHIRAIVTDVDGVLTASGITLRRLGDASITFSARDGFAIKDMVRRGIEIVWLTGRGGAPVQARASELGVRHLLERSPDKVADARRWGETHGIALAQMLYIGDDLPDADLLARCGIAACPADADPYIRCLVDWVLPVDGGDGCLRVIRDAYLTSCEQDASGVVAQ